MKNGDLDSKGILASIIGAEGTVESFKVSDNLFSPDLHLPGSFACTSENIEHLVTFVTSSLKITWILSE